MGCNWLARTFTNANSAADEESVRGYQPENHQDFAKYLERFRHQRAFPEICSVMPDSVSRISARTNDFERVQCRRLKTCKAL
jgi:hypothetical protein